MVEFWLKEWTVRYNGYDEKYRDKENYIVGYGQEQLDNEEEHFRFGVRISNQSPNMKTRGQWNLGVGIETPKKKDLIKMTSKFNDLAGITKKNEILRGRGSSSEPNDLFSTTYNFLKKTMFGEEKFSGIIRIKIIIKEL